MSAVVPPVAPPAAPDEAGTTFTPTGARRRRHLLLVAAALLAGAGVAYELGLMLLGTITVGATEQANALVLGTAMFGMGLGAITGGRVARRPVLGFVAVESALASVGALSGPLLYFSWAATNTFWAPLLIVALVLGWLIGAEMPLLAALNSRLATQSPEQVVSAYTAADYFGALVGSILFGFLVRPALGLLHGTALVAGANLVVAGAVALALLPIARREGRTWALPAVLAAGTAAVVVAVLVADPLQRSGRQRLFRDPIVATLETAHQDLVITARDHVNGPRDVRLYINGRLQLSTVDEYRYHEALVHPVLGAGAKRVVILGGGDCMAAREALHHPGVEAVTLVELDPEMLRLADELPELTTPNEHACRDPRVTVVTSDAFSWVREAPAGSFDAAVLDFPDPDAPALGRLYSVELYGMLSRVLTPEARVGLQCGSPFLAAEHYWTCAATLEAAGWQVTPYTADVPSFGTWGFHLAARSGAPELSLAPTDRPRRYLSEPVLDALTTFPPDRARANYDVRPSTVAEPFIVEAAKRSWVLY